MKTEPVDRPILKMPQDAQDLVRETYETASVILEYGSGGSTVLASEMESKTVFSVESDRNWARKMQRWFKQNPPAANTQVNVRWVNIGATREWGFPVDDENWARFPRYPLSIWQSDDFQHPDVVLVDGRFRVGCALATAFNITRPVTLLFDDYANRRHMHTVEEFLEKPDLVGRMAIFHVKPLKVEANRLIRIFRLLTRP